MALEASVEHLCPRTGLAQLSMEASSDSGGTYPWSLKARMWAAGPDLAPSTTSIFSSGFPEGLLMAVWPAWAAGTPTGRMGAPHALGLQTLLYLLWPF